jgi:hypothetical protein
MNTKEGIEAICDVDILNEQMKVMEEQEKKKFYNENKGAVRHGDADSIIEERLSPKREQVEDKMIKIMEDAVAKTEGKFNIQVGQQIDEKPDPKTLPVGYKLQEDNGIIWTNNGTKWIPKKG